MTLDALQNLLLNNLQNTTTEFQRIFHGRGGVYEGESKRNPPWFYT